LSTSKRTIAASVSKGRGCAECEYADHAVSLAQREVVSPEAVIVDAGFGHLPGHGGVEGLRLVGQILRVASELIRRIVGVVTDLVPVHADGVAVGAVELPLLHVCDALLLVAVALGSVPEHLGAGPAREVDARTGLERQEQQGIRGYEDQVEALGSALR
jgi:hypothetical protein